MLCDGDWLPVAFACRLADASGNSVCMALEKEILIAIQNQNGRGWRSCVEYSDGGFCFLFAVCGPIELSARVYMGSSFIVDSIRDVDQLPALTAVAQKLLSLDLSSDQGEKSLVDLIAEDPQILAKIIGLANSPAFSNGQTVVTADRAALVLGLAIVKSIATSIALMSCFQRIDRGWLKSDYVIRHGLRVVEVMKIISTRIPRAARPALGSIYLAGMIHDIGHTVVAFLDGGLSDSLHGKLYAGDATDSDIEMSVLGATHGEIGAKLAGMWHLPPEIVAAIRYHHNPSEDAENLMIVKLTGMAEEIVDDFEGVMRKPSNFDFKRITELGVNEDQIDALADSISVVLSRL